MLSTIAIVLIVLWILGLVSGYTWWASSSTSFSSWRSS